MPIRCYRHSLPTRSPPERWLNAPRRSSRSWWKLPDAGATRIDIDIERGGAKLIRIRDNGCGIGKDDLALALARHATSKISTLDDTEAIVSLGFSRRSAGQYRSVSRLTLTSRTADQSEAWQLMPKGASRR